MSMNVGWIVSVMLHAGLAVALGLCAFGAGRSGTEERPVTRIPLICIPLTPAAAEESVVEEEPASELPEAAPEPTTVLAARPEVRPEPAFVENAEPVPEAAAVIAPPDYSGNKPPAYPRLARRLGYEGTVVLTATVSAAGMCLDVTVKQPSGYRLLDEAAVNSVRNWTFNPAVDSRGSAVVAAIEIPIRFVLEM